MKRIVFTAEITLTVDDNGTQQTFYMSTHGFTSRPGDTPANTVFLPYLEDPGTLRRELFTGARVSGPVRSAFGQTVLTNHEGVLDYWMGYGFSGGRVVVRRGEEGAAYPAGFSTVFIAYAYAPIISFDRIRIPLRDRLYKLDEPIATDIFKGTGGLEGTGIAQRKKQIVFGRPGFVPITLINAPKRIYHVMENAADERAFRSTNPPLYLPFVGGRGLSFDGYYTSEEDLLDGAAPGAGKFKIYGPGVDGSTPDTTESTGPIFIRLGSQPEHELRFLPLGLLKQGVGLPARTWKFTDLLVRANAPATLAPGSYQKNVGNILCDDEQTYLDVMTDACTPTFSAYGFDRLDRFFTLDLRDPTEGADAPVLVINRNNAEGITRQLVPGGEVPFAKVSVSVGRSWPTSSLRTDLDEEEREVFERGPWQATFTGASAAVERANLGATTANVEIKGNELTSVVAKGQFVRRFIYLFGARRELINLTMDLTEETIALDLHSKVELRMPRFGCDAGRLFRLITHEINCSARTVTLGLWGGTPGPEDAVLGGGSASPGGGTGQVGIVSGEGLIGEFELIAYGRRVGGIGGDVSLEEFGLVAYGRKVEACVSGPVWSAGTIPGSPRNNLNIASDGAGRILVGSSVSTAAVLYSTDGGATWTAGTNPATGGFAYSIGFGGGIFFAHVNAIESAYSTDGGATWTTSTHGSISPGATTNPIYAFGKFFVFANTTGNFYTTANGVTYSSGTTAIANAANQGMAFGGGRLVTVGSSGGTVYAQYSTDGVTFTAATTVPAFSVARMAYGNGKFVAMPFGASGSTFYSYTSDGVTWTSGTLPFSADWIDVVFAQGVFIAIATGTNRMATSLDGISWTEVPTGNRFTSAGGFNRIVYSGVGTYVAMLMGTGTVINRGTC